MVSKPAVCYSCIVLSLLLDYGHQRTFLNPAQNFLSGMKNRRCDRTHSEPLERGDVDRVICSLPASKYLETKARTKFNYWTIRKGKRRFYSINSTSTIIKRILLRRDHRRVGLYPSFAFCRILHTRFRGPMQVKLQWRQVLTTLLTPAVVATPLRLLGQLPGQRKTTRR